MIFSFVDLQPQLDAWVYMYSREKSTGYAGYKQLHLYFAAGLSISH
jgi:hypothetical protein